MKKANISGAVSPSSVAVQRVTEATECAVRDHVSAAVSFFRERLRLTNEAARDPRSARFELITSIDQQRAVETYKHCIAQLGADEAVARHLGRLVGTSSFVRRLNADDLLKDLIFEMQDASGELKYSHGIFLDRWKAIVSFLESREIRSISIFPINGLTLSTAPIVICDGIELDYLSEAEIERCANVGVLLPRFHGDPRPGEFLGTAGIRITNSVAKVIDDGEENLVSVQNESDRGSFGRRPLSMENLTAEDVMVALRLLKHTTVRCNGWAKWSDSFWVGGGISYSRAQDRFQADTCSLTEPDIEVLHRVWGLLRCSAGGLSFSLRRFSQSFERADPDDRIVDLVIAGESVFLGDMVERGELRLRFALRSAKFVDHPTYNRSEIYDLMQRAYDARSAIVHGGHPNPKKVFLPDDRPGTLKTFSDNFENVIRLAILKAISIPEGKPGVHNKEYWMSLFLDS